MAASRSRSASAGRTPSRRTPTRRAATRRSPFRHLTIPLVMLIVFAFIGTGTYLALTHAGTALRSGDCTASGLGARRSYSSEQTANAALIAAVAVDRSLPPRAASIALATAYQESQLRNIDHGDRDSLGLFQQRPSQDWGTAEQIMDPIYASNAFYDALVKIPGYQGMDLNDAAQRVQRSGVPEGYRDHETEGRIYASALTGQSGANLVCELAMPDAPADPRAVQDQLGRQFPRLTAAGAITSSLVPARGSLDTVPAGAGATALAIDTHGNEQLGWALANWAVARAGDDGAVMVAHGGAAWDRSAADTQPGTWTGTAQHDPQLVIVLVAGG